MRYKYRGSDGRFAKQPEPESGAIMEWIIGILLALIVLGVLAAMGSVVRGDEPKPPCPALASRHDPVLDVFARHHANRQAELCVQGHQDFGKRAARLRSLFPSREITEICAESWRRQANYTEAALWKEAVRCWKQSEGHWSVAKCKHWRIGSAMAKGKNEIFYMTVIAVD